MDNTRWGRIEALFDRVIGLPAADRRPFLETEAAGDGNLIDEVLALAGAHEASHPILDGGKNSPLPSGMRLGPWAIDSLLGAGGMGAVYLAHRADHEFDKKVAVKVLSHGLASAIHEDRFRRERRLLAVLDHPNIARLLDSGVNEFGQPYLVMELVDGQPLNEWYKSGRPSLDDVLEVWLKIAAAVSFAHRNLIVHLDLKPSNVLVTREGEPKLLDFGIARLLDGDECQATRTVYLTPGYASPEQMAGGQVSTASDVYSLGMLLGELIGNDIPGDLRAVLGMALRHEPERRYASADQFAEDVLRFQKRLPVKARPESWRYRAGKFVLRHKMGVVLGGAAVVSLLLAASIAVWQAGNADRQRARAEKVSDFLASIMGATPDGTRDSLRGRGVSLRVVDLVNGVAARVDRELANDPEAESTLRYIIGSTYWQMGLLDQAVHNASRGVELAERLYGADDPRLLNAKMLRALVRVELGEFADAERESLEIERKWRNPPPFASANMLSTLGVAQFRLGKLDEAEATFKRCLSIMEKVTGRQEWLGVILANFSLVYQERGQYELALPLLERAVATARPGSEKGSESLAWALANLANVHRILGNHERALAAAEVAYRHFAATLGESNHRIVNAAVHVASAKTMLGDAAGGETVLRKAMAVQQSLPPDHIERALTQSFLGMILLKQGRLREAREATVAALQIRRKAFRAPNWRIAETAGQLGEILARLEDRAGARPLLEESADTFTRLYGAGSIRAREARERLDHWAPSK